MKIFTVLFIAALSFACTNSAKPVPQSAAESNTASNARAQTAIAHSSENKAGPATAPNGRSGWTQGGDPIDTTELDAAVTAAEKALAAKPNDAAAKKALSKAYLDRATKLTDARQYAAALGDYRKAVKHDATNEEAKEWIERIVQIYDSINKSYPKEGEEPGPLPFKAADKPKS
jgi:tetratricopeptide (TPR) repeat protein